MLLPASLSRRWLHDINTLTMLKHLLVSYAWPQVTVAATATLCFLQHACFILSWDDDQLLLLDFPSCNKCSCCFQSSLVEFFPFKQWKCSPSFSVASWSLLVACSQEPQAPLHRPTESTTVSPIFCELTYCTALATSVESADNGHEMNEKDTCRYVMEQSAAFQQD